MPQASEDSAKPGAGKPTPAPAGHDPLFLWTVTVCLCVLAAGWSGMLREAWSPGVLSGYTAEEASGGMEAKLDEPADAAALEEAAPPAESVETEQPAEPEPEPQEEALTVEDVLEIPPPPVLETVERSAIPPVPRENPQPKPRPQPVKPATSAVKPQPVRRPANAAGASSAPARPPAGTGAGDGAGGPGRGGKGSGKAKTPQPSYPAFARSGKMTGTVVVSLVVDPSGAVVSATVIRSCGHPRLDAHTCSFIRSRWRWPAGERRTHTVPVIYRLR